MRITVQYFLSLSVRYEIYFSLIFGVKVVHVAISNIPDMSALPADHYIHMTSRGHASAYISGKA